MTNTPTQEQVHKMEQEISELKQQRDGLLDALRGVAMHYKNSGYVWSAVYEAIAKTEHKQ